jgi:anaerobic magnesium-protoporphyrin IX monomethyl ester cyclase
MPNSRILLTIIPMFWPKYPPLGLGYLQAYLMHRGLEADILDLNNFFYHLADPQLKKDWLVSANTFLEKKIISLLQEEHADVFESKMSEMLGYDVIGFSCFKSNLENTLAVAGILKSRKPGIKIVLGGPEMMRQHFKTSGAFSEEIHRLADHIVVGEGEESFYRFVTGPPQEKVSLFSQFGDLAKLPHPRFKGMDFGLYRRDAVPVEFSRGCVRRCNFCSERILFKGYRSRSVEGFLDEMDFYRRERGIQYFIFFDSMLNGDIRKMEQLLDGIIARFGSVRWEAQMAVREDMGLDIMEKMKKSGCYNIFIGLESGCDSTLKKMNKGFTTAQASGFIKRLHQAGLNFGVSMMVGYPGETDADFEESLAFILKHRHMIPKIEQVNPFTYYDGTTAEKDGDYRLHPESLERMQRFVKEITENNMRYTKAFIGNLIEKSYYADAVRS